MKFFGSRRQRGAGGWHVCGLCLCVPLVGHAVVVNAITFVVSYSQPARLSQPNRKRENMKNHFTDHAPCVIAVLTTAIHFSLCEGKHQQWIKIHFLSHLIHIIFNLYVKTPLYFVSLPFVFASQENHHFRNAHIIHTCHNSLLFKYFYSV